ncbi:energy transducer TonB [Pontibacter cellulosilyticus]|uniref:TonB family protein n=1 Tax=Pontibacter cellulosilyticus TaxID=1720253 RepID=A0A923N8I4_9BACT|nr:energy transducer TonB [Pontibacter cellulosilyticus]MBC5994159.1 TonB family protein [Pontibacter cellulosilyticus]
MRLLFTLAVTMLLSIVAPGNVMAQVKHVMYYDKDMVQVNSKEEAHFVELIERETDKDLNGTISLYKASADSATLIKKGYYNAVFHPRKVQGQLITYYPNGKRKGVQTYEDGILHGLDIEWHENDSLRQSIGYEKGKYNGELKTYYKSGKLKREELYKNGEQQYGKCYAEDGSEVAFVPYREMPVFRGGERAMLQYLGQNIRYPASSQRNRESGVVVINFTVNKHGGINNPRVIRSISRDLDKEALRVVSGMSGWTPGTFEGEKVDVLYTLPVRFTIR